MLVFYWQRAFFTFLLLAIFVAGTFNALKYGKKIRTGKTDQDSNKAGEEPPELKAQKPLTPSTAQSYPLSINFPAITKPLPSVWGVGETLMIEVFDEAKNEHEEKAIMPVAGKRLYFFFGDGTREEFQFVNPTQLDYTYVDKGVYELSIKEPGSDKVYGLDTVKIVDYREEIIDLAHNLFKILRKKDPSLSEDLTPREIIEKGLVPFLSSKAIDDRTLKEIILLIEYATYSLKEITRSDYETFYRLLDPVLLYLEEQI